MLKTRELLIRQRTQTANALRAHMAEFGFAVAIIKQGKRGLKLPEWVAGLVARKPFKVVAVALANKNARIIWALLTKGGVYQKPKVASVA